MALHNLARMTVSGTPGTGTITLVTNVTGFLTFDQAGVANAEVVSYGIADGDRSEVGIGTYTTATKQLTRGPTASTSGGAAISVSSAAHVYITARAEDIVSSVFGNSPTAGNVAASASDYANIHMQTKGVTVAPTGTGEAGAIWAQANIGMGFRSAVSSPAFSPFAWYNFDGVELLMRFEPTTLQLIVTNGVKDVLSKIETAAQGMAGDLNITKTTPLIRLEKTASGQSAGIQGRLAGSGDRWFLVLGDGTTESGNAGSDFRLKAYNNAGPIHDPLVFQRDSGDALISSNLQVSGSTGALSKLGGGGIAVQGVNIHEAVPAAGYIGEYKSAPFSGIALTTATTANCASFNLTAGDWDVSAVGMFTQGSTTNIKRCYITLTSVSSTATNVNAGFWSQQIWDGTNGIVPGTSPQVLNIGPTRVSSSTSSTTWFLNANATFTVSTSTVSGILTARRVR